MRIVCDENIKVLTGDEWLFRAVDGLTNDKGTAILKPVIDPNGNPILGKAVLVDPDWNPDAEIINPETGETTTFRKESIEIAYCYNESE